MTEVYFSLGSNLGDRQQNIFRALDMLDVELGCHYDALSGIIETEPWGFDAEEMFLNCAVRYIFAGNMACQEVLSACKKVEVLMGRSVHCPEFDSAGKRIYRSRIIDIDILFYGEHRIDAENLKVPHPLMREREFVMVPLGEIASPGIRTAFPEIFSGM